MALQFKVPEQFGGKSLRDISGEGTPLGRTDILANFFGIDEATPLQPGQTLTYSGDISPGSAEFQGAQRIFGQGKTPEQALKEEGRARLGEFTGRLQQVPEELEAVRQEMGIPQAFETFGALGKTARGVAQRVEDLP